MLLTVHLSASMEPQLYRCGNLVSDPKVGAMTCFNGAATLSLRKFDPGLMQELYDWALQWGRNFIVAEMGGGVYSNRFTFVLQWGRNFIVAEINQRTSERSGNPQLQWGRNFIVAEIRSRPYAGTLRLGASMGPQLYRCGNELRLSYALPQNIASMGLQLYRCGNCNCTSPLSTMWTLRFNGAATLSLRKYCSSTSRITATRCFNGAATLSLRK